MIQWALKQLNVSIFAELALLMFAIIFVAVVIRTLLTRRDVTLRQANIVLGDSTEKQP